MGTQGRRLLDRVGGDVARARDDHPAAGQGQVAGAEHLLGEVDQPVAGRLRAHLGAAEGEPLARQDTGLVAVGDPLVLAEEVADLPAAHPDVTGGDVGVLPEVPVELGHHRLAETHDLRVAATLRVEVRPALAATDREAGQRVLEDLLEAEELHDPEVDRGVEAQAALEGAERGVELHAERPVHLDLAGVVGPRDPEDQLALGLADALDDRGVDVLRVLAHDRAERLQHLQHRLVELLLTGVARQDDVVVGGDQRVEVGHGRTVGIRDRPRRVGPPGGP